MKVRIQCAAVHIITVLSPKEKKTNFDVLLLDVDELCDWDDWSFGWSFKICIVGLLAQILTTLSIGYGLLLFPLEEVVEEEEAAAAEK